MRRRELCLALATVVSGPWSDHAWSALTDDEAKEVAMRVVERVAGTAEQAAVRYRGRRGPTVVVDERWWVWVDSAMARAAKLSDQGYRLSAHAKHKLVAPPAHAEIEAAALELLHRVFPGFDMAEFVVESAKPQGEQARVEARWRRVIPECGFPGPGLCFVDFCWPDRAISGMGAECPPIPDEWRRPASIAAEQAEATARDALGDLRGGWLRTTKDYCVVDPRDDAKSRPAWNVTLLLGSRDKPEECEADRSVFVDPWSGDVVTIKECMGDRPVGTSGPVVASRGASRAGARTVGAVAAHSWPPWAGGGAAVVVIALGAT
ncbi:MAG TPA: hypothetical protein PLQ54_19655, partial [Armatimonadota bacterium]|nr:hypothetical protein [Armatimonadota bacterium]